MQISEIFMNFTGSSRANINTVGFPSGALRVIHFLDEKIEFLFHRTCCEEWSMTGEKSHDDNWTKL